MKLFHQQAFVITKKRVITARFGETNLQFMKNQSILFHLGIFKKTSDHL